MARDRKAEKELVRLWRQFHSARTKTEDLSETLTRQLIEYSASGRVTVYRATKLFGETEFPITEQGLRNRIRRFRRREETK